MPATRSPDTRARVPLSRACGHYVDWFRLFSRADPVSDSVSAIIVSYSDPEATLRAVRSLLAQSLPLTEVLILDNHPDAPIATSVEDWHEGGRVRLIHTGRNLGYPAACNRGADAARGDWLFFLNPDAYAHPDCVSTLLGCADEATSVVGAQVLLPDGRTNAGDNPVHVTGVAWAGRYGQQREHGPPRQVASVSGAALLARASAYKALGGMCERFFLYLDDVDLCWRVRLAGWQVAFCPEALVWHDYEFDKGKEKWYWLERNRHWTVLANYSPLSLLVLAPMLAGAELMVLGLALRERWVRQLDAGLDIDLARCARVAPVASDRSGQPACLRPRDCREDDRALPDCRARKPCCARGKPFDGSLSARPSGGPGLRGSLNARRPRGSPAVILPVRLQPDVDRLRNIYLHSTFESSDMSDAPTYLAVVPAYNESATIMAVIQALRARAPQFDVLVVDDGSTDDTATVASLAGPRVLKLPFNVGIGGAVQAGFVFARDHRYDFMAQVDGDGQHEPAELERLVAAMAGGQGPDMVCGSRFLSDDFHYPAPVSRRTGIHVFAALLSRIVGRACERSHIWLSPLQPPCDRTVRAGLPPRLS